MVQPYYEANLLRGWWPRGEDRSLVDLKEAFAALSQWLRQLIECCFIRSAFARMPATQAG